MSQSVRLYFGTLTLIEGEVEHTLGKGDCLELGPPAAVTYANRTARLCRYLVLLVLFLYLVLLLELEHQLSHSTLGGETQTLLLGLFHFLYLLGLLWWSRRLAHPVAAGAQQAHRIAVGRA